MSELAVGSISGLAANSYVIDVASGSQLTQPGMVLQVVQATYSTQVTTSSSSFVSTPLALSITPSSTSSKILIMVYLTAKSLRDPSTSSGSMQHAIDRDGAVIIETPIIKYQDNADSTGRSIDYPISLSYLDSPATTSAVTYTHQHKNDTDSVRSFVSDSMGTLIAMEIAG